MNILHLDEHYYITEDKIIRDKIRYDSKLKKISNRLKHHINMHINTYSRIINIANERKCIVHTHTLIRIF